MNFCWTEKEEGFKCTLELFDASTIPVTVKEIAKAESQSLEGAQWELIILLDALFPQATMPEDPETEEHIFQLCQSTTFLMNAGEVNRDYGRQAAYSWKREALRNKTLHRLGFLTYNKASKQAQMGTALRY